MGDFSTFLFARPSAMEGVGRILDFGNVLNEYNYSPTPEQADAIALWADWLQVGRDMKSALSAYSEKGSPSKAKASPRR